MNNVCLLLQQKTKSDRYIEFDIFSYKWFESACEMCVRLAECMCVAEF